MTGALSFIGMLLVMAGVESNPGPGPDKMLVFRYLYLLIEVGTNMLRKVFDQIVHPDFKVYLDNNPDRQRDFDALLSSRHKPTLVQQQLLPPNDNAPSSEKFDITLLACLLRHACGLRPSSNKVWSKPKSTDKGVEVYINRLRECRNKLVHSGSVYEDETVLTTKWDELCEILQGLSSYCSFGGLQAMIDKATSLEMDDTQYGTYDQSIQKWRLEEIQSRLITTYQKDVIFSSLPLFPLDEDEKGDIFGLYELPTMYAENYHKVVKKKQTDKSPDELEKVNTCSDLFQVKDKVCKNIYLTGDAGVGKSSFCKFLSLSWCKSKLGEKLDKNDMQDYINYLARFEFVFYVNLRDTQFTDLKAIVVNQLFFSENKDSSNRMYDIVEEILGYHDSLVIMDGLDEWTPKPTDKRYEIPVRPTSLKSVYLTTCRPYKIENVRLSETNLDHTVKMTGLGEKEIESYVSNLLNIINIKCNGENTQKEFMKAVEKANLLDMLHIPMTTSHLVMLWLDRPLTSMSKSLIYGNIMDMLFKIDDKKKRDDIQQSEPIPPANLSKLKLPDRLSELKDFEKHFSEIEPLCLLSYRLLFEHDTDITSHVFTRDQLASEPYCLSKEEIKFFCTIGILSMKKVKTKFGPKECKLSFLHKSYLEFFAAIYVSTLDTSDVLKVFSQCRTINDVLEYTNYLIFYAGLSIEIDFVSLMTRIYSLISKDLDLTRLLSIFPTDNHAEYKKYQLWSLQDLILKCYMQGSYLIKKKPSPLEDFLFCSEYLTDTETKYLRKLISSNSNNVRLLSSETGEYFDEFNEINNLQVLYIKGSFYKKYNREFNELIKQHKSSLQIISIKDAIEAIPLLHLGDFQYLTSLSLETIYMPHEDIEYLTKFLSNNSLLKHVSLILVMCLEHFDDECGSFELAQCNKLVYLDIVCTNVVCTNINTSFLEYIKLYPLFDSIARGYIYIFNSIQYALELKYLNINGGRYGLDDHLVGTLITNVQYLSKIESIELGDITLRDNVSFLLHPSVKQVSIRLWMVKMTTRWFQTFIESVRYKHCCIKLMIDDCKIRQDDGDTKGSMSHEESVDYIHDFIKSISAKNIVEVDRTWSRNITFVINDNQ